MTDPRRLLQVDSSLEVLVLRGDPAGEAVPGWVEAGLVVRVVRGRKMRKLGALYDEFAAGFQFPGYFGENADAFDECIADLGWLAPQAGFVVVVTEPDQVLVEERADGLRWLVGSLSSACAMWACPVADGEWWDRAAVPFHVVLLPSEAAEGQAIARWVAAGASVSPYTDQG